MILKYLHIALVFSGIVTVVGTEVILHLIARTGDPSAIRTAFRAARRVPIVGSVLFFAGVAFGAAAGFVNGYNMLAPWLLATYALVLAVLAAGLTVSEPWTRRVESLATASADGPASPELHSALHARAPYIVMWMSVAVDFTIVALMVFKPGA